MLNKNKKNEYIPNCQVSKKNTINSDTITYRTKGEFVYKVEQPSFNINALESGVSFKKLKTGKEIEMTLLLSTFTYSDKSNFVVKSITIKFIDESKMELQINDNIEQALNDKINVVGNFINLNKQQYNILSDKDIKSIELKSANSLYKLTPFQKVIKEQIKCILKEINSNKV